MHRFAVLIAAALQLAACSATIGETTSAVQSSISSFFGPDGKEVHAHVAPVTPAAASDAERAVNAYRAERGLPAVTQNAALNRAAAAYAAKLAGAGKVTHTLKGSTLPKRLAAVGYDWGAAAENLGGGYISMDHAMYGWKTSKKGHNQILLRRGVTEMGFAMVNRPKTRHSSYWVLILAREREPGESQEYVEVAH